MKYLIIIASSLLLLASCKEGDADKNTKPTKTVLSFTLTKLAKDNAHKVDSNQLRGLVSSGDGEYVYLVSEQVKGLRVLNVEKGIWEEGLDKWNEVPNARVRATLVDISAERVGGFDSYDKGLLFTVTGDKGLVVLKGAGSAHATLYPQNAGQFPNGKFVPLMVTRKDNNQFIYLFPSKTVATDSVLFRTYKAPPDVDDYTGATWNNSLKKAAATPLNTEIFARAQDNEKNLLLADKDGIKRVLDADVGVDAKFLDNKGNAVYGPDDFRLDGKTKNDHINTMQLIDNKLLVVGLKSTSADNGGVAILDLSDKTAKWQHFGKGLGLSVDAIAPERLRDAERTNLAAIITTQKGLLLMDNEGKMVEMAEGKGHVITAKIIGDVRAEVKDYDKAVNDSRGFLGDRPVAVKDGDYLSAAQDKNGIWYLAFKGSAADDGGVYKLDIKQEAVEPPTAPPELPQ